MPNTKTKDTFLMAIRHFFGALMLLFLMGSCNRSPKVLEAVEKIDINLEVSRFDQEFAAARPQDIAVLKKKYPYLFPKQFPDSVWRGMLSDSLQRVIRAEVANAFPDFAEEEEGLTLLFKHITHYFPQYTVPKVVTVTNNVDYENRVIATDSLLLLSLDNYLGPDHKFYEGMSAYIAAELDKDFLVSDVASAFANKTLPRLRDRSFLARMVFYGKLLYIKDLWMPLATDPQKIRYTEAELEWALENEAPIWRNFIANEYLYSTESKLTPRFLEPAPFSKFGLELDNESPGRIGRFIGWQIVRSFMEKNNITLQQLLTLSADDLFKKSNYKPKK